MKTAGKFLVILLVYTGVYLAATMLMPFSQAFTNLTASATADPWSLPFLLLSNAWFCFAMCYIVSHARWRGLLLITVVTGVIFFVASFMTQVETLFFNHAFPVLTKQDVFLIALSGLFPLLAAVPLTARLFNKKDAPPARFAKKYTIGGLFLPVLSLGLVYVVIYFLFGYFVAWQNEALRLFYSGTMENEGFWGQLVRNWETYAIIYPFQFIRGILFALAAIPLLYLTKGSNRHFVISVCLVYLCTAIVLIIPNVLFPDTVRWGHFIEMTSSMLLFGLITGFTLARCRKLPHVRGQRPEARGQKA